MSPIITLYLLTLAMGIGMFWFAVSFGKDQKSEAKSK